MKKYYYLYETTNLTNGKKYIGQHCTRDLNDGYFGSSKKLIEDVKGGDKVSVKILKFCKDIYELGNIEYEEIKKRGATSDPTYYNTNNGRYFNAAFEYGRTDEDKRKISKGLAGKKRKKSSKPVWNKGLTTKTDERVKKYSIKQGLSNRGRHVWNKGIKSGLVWINNGTDPKFIRTSELEGYIKKGWALGRRLATSLQSKTKNN